VVGSNGDAQVGAVEAQHRDRSPGRPGVNPGDSVPERLSYLFETVHPAGQRPYSAAEVTRAINDGGGKISSVYILKILSGERPDPSARYLKLIAKFFGVSLAYFYDDVPPELDANAMSAQITLRNPRLQEIMLRAARLSTKSQAAVRDIIDSILAAEGVTDAEFNSRQGEIQPDEG
jgi:transcriptional regulator with XRE-family HTH domain